MFHDDRGSPYAGQAMVARLTEYGRMASMSRKGDCLDNAPTEFNSLTNERVRGTACPTRAEAQADLFEYAEVIYIRSRRHSPLDYSSPGRFLENWMREHAVQHSKAA
jgi:transposase InsO family protein